MEVCGEYGWEHYMVYLENMMDIWSSVWMERRIEWKYVENMVGSTIWFIWRTICIEGALSVWGDGSMEWMNNMINRWSSIWMYGSIEWKYGEYNR